MPKCGNICTRWNGLLNSLNCVNSICFGSEIGDIDILYLISKILIDEPIDFKIKLKDYLDKGTSFPKSKGICFILLYNRK
ncbi:MAG: nucleotidyltransferase family protein [Clostridioides difficile]